MLKELSGMNKVILYSILHKRHINRIPAPMCSKWTEEHNEQLRVVFRVISQLWNLVYTGDLPSVENKD
jgi:hypothetical protein